jgi:hypothetical protein
MKRKYPVTKMKKKRYFFLYKYWIAFKIEYIRQRNERKFYRLLNMLSKRPEAITEELTYPATEIVTNLKTVSMSNLPIRKTTRIIKVTQIPCKPLEFMPTELYRY